MRYLLEFTILFQSGFIGVNARAGIWNPLSYSAQLSHGSLLTAYVPHSCNTPKQGWSHDFIIHHMYSSIESTVTRIISINIMLSVRTNRLYLEYLNI